MRTICKQSADGIVLIGDNKLDTTQGKVFINNHEITDIDTFFKVAEENTRLLEQVKKQKEVIDNAVEYVKNNLIVASTLDGKKYYYLNDYGFSYKELLKILQDKEVSE